jgi:hypothetical protein
MKHFIYWFIIAAFSFSLAPFAAAQNLTVPAGEKLTFNVTFATFPDAAYIELYAAGKEKVGERELFAVRAKVRTGGTVQATLIDLNNDYTTFIAPETGFPVRTEKFVRNDGKNGEVRRDFAENQIVSDLNVHDLISAIYQLRRLEFNEKTPQIIKVWDNDKVYEAKFQVTGRETISTPIGAVNALIVQVKTNDDAFNRYNVKIYLSDDERKLPVMITAKLPQGVIRAELSSVQIATPQPVAVVQPTPAVPQPTPVVRPTVRPTLAPKPYVENQPLDTSLPFALGENLKFEVLRGGQKVGTVTMAVKDRKQHFGRDSVLLLTTAEAANNSALFNTGDKIESYIHPDFIVPLRHQVQLSGFLAGFNQFLEFDQERGAVTNSQAASIEVPVGTYDVLSFIYALRAFKYSFAKNAPGTRASVFLGDTPQIVTLTPVRETIDFNKQKISTIAVTAQTNNPQVDSLGLRLWMSDDARRLPLKLTLNTPQGIIEANLVGF